MIVIFWTASVGLVPHLLHINVSSFSYFAAWVVIIIGKKWHDFYFPKNPSFGANGQFSPILGQNWVIWYLRIRLKNFFETLQHNLVLQEDKNYMFEISPKVPVRAKLAIWVHFGAKITCTVKYEFWRFFYTK